MSALSAHGALEGWPGAHSPDRTFWDRFRLLVEERYGLRLAEHQARRLLEEVQRLATAAGMASVESLYEAMISGARADLLATLASHLTIGETHFFRVGPQVQALREVILPELIARRADRRQLRIWSAGCSTGEEPYTIAILLREQLPAFADWDVSILATDVSPQALAAAHDGLYGEWSFRDTPAEVRQRYFAPEGKRWRLSEAVRRMVHFQALNLVADALSLPDGDVALGEGAALDLILCRNVTIYFGPETTQRLYARFADALAGDGWLILGPSDPAPEPGGCLHPAYLPGAVLWRRVAPASVPAGSHTALPSSVSGSRAGAASRFSPGGLRYTAAPRSGGAAGIPRRSTPSPAARLGAPQQLTEQQTQREASLATARMQPDASGAAPAAEVWALVQSGQRVAARAAVEAMVRRQPADPEAHLLLGMLELDEGADESALEALRRATFLDAGNALAHFSLGRAYRRHNEPERARAALAHARRLIATLADDLPVPGGGDLAAGELRLAVDAALKERP